MITQNANKLQENLTEKNLKENLREKFLNFFFDCLYDSLSTLTTIISNSIGIDKIDFIIADESHKLNENTTKQGKQKI